MPAAMSVRFGSEFEPFLLATIGEEKNGMPLSVLSALARQDIDPWQEAADLARMPKEAAKRRLATLMAGFATRQLSVPDPGATPSRLIALLPRSAVTAITSGKVVGKIAVPTGTVPQSRAIIIIILINLLLLSGVQLAVRAVPGHQPSAQADRAVAQTGTPHIQQDPPKGTDRR